jgi:hypothetical protein
MSKYVFAYVLGISAVLGSHLYQLIDPNYPLTKEQHCYVNIAAALLIMYYFTQ